MRCCKGIEVNGSDGFEEVALTEDAARSRSI